jgi:hypothetical protein
MKKHIAEDLPARKYAPAAQGSGDDRKSGKEEKSPESRVRQAVYDIRYRARREEIALRQAFSQYMQNSSMSQQERTLVKQKLFGKGGMQAEDFKIESFASDNVADALYKVFVEGNKVEEQIKLVYLEDLQTSEDRKYKVRVTDPKNKVTYIRYATREKISDLRSKGLDVEMTGYGEPYEGEKKKGEQTASALGGGKKNDGDLANNYPPYNKVTRGDVVAGRRGEDQMGGKGKVAEDFLGEVSDESLNPDANQKTIDVMKKGQKNEITINPDVPGSNSTKQSGFVVSSYTPDGDIISENGYEKFLKIVNEKINLNKASMGDVIKDFYTSDAPQFKGKSKEKRRDMALAAKLEAERAAKEGSETGCGDQPIRDKRGDATKENLVKNKLRAMGMKNPIVMTAGYQQKGDQIDEVLGGQSGDGYIGHPRLGIRNPMSPPKKPSSAPETASQNTGIAGRLGNVQSEKERQIQQLLKQSYKIDGDVVSEEESDRVSDRAREGGDWRSRSQRPPVRRRPSVADDPRYGSMSDEEWARSSKNPRNQPRPRRRRY